jgi:nucleotide exchange factor SIL1
VTKKFKSYEEIKRDLKDINLTPKTEAEVLIQLMEEFANSSESRLAVLQDLEYHLHSIDNALLFISRGGLEKIVIPHLVNHTDVMQRVVLLKMVGAIAQNNPQAKNYICNKTNLIGDVVSIVDKCENHEVLSAGLFGLGSVVRTNSMVTDESMKKVIAVLVKIIAKDTVGVGLKTKALVLMGDVVTDSQIDPKPLDLCQQISKFFEINKNFLITDTDAAEKTATSLLSLSEKCSMPWSEQPMMRHTLLVVLNNYRIRLNEESDEDARFVYSLVVEHFENLNGLLYGELKISSDDLSDRYSRDEL